MLSNIVEFINYWWFRYLMVTELYMVEKWERVTIHVVFLILFILFWFFNYKVLLSITGNILGVTPISTVMQQNKFAAL